MECFFWLHNSNLTDDSIQIVWFQYLFHLGPQHLLVNQTNVNQANTLSLESGNITFRVFLFCSIKQKRF